MRKYILFFAFMLISLSLFAVEDDLFGVNNMGRNFIFTVPPCIESDSPFDNKVLLYVSSPYRTWVNINIDAANLRFSVQILENQTEIIELPANDVVPYSKGIIDIEAGNKIFEDYAISINAENPISLVASVRFNQSSDAFTVIPREALGMEYVISSYNDASEFYPSVNSLSSVAGISAPFDNTKVDILLGGNENTVIPGNKQSGDTIRVVLNAGDVYMLPTIRNRSDLSGTVIKSSKQVSVISGNQNANIPIDNGNSDYIANMELPTYTWGKEYLVPYSEERNLSSVVRVYAKEENTNVYINGELFTTLDCKTRQINDSYFETRIYSDSQEKSAAYIRADKPIAVSMYNTGVDEDGLPQKSGGPNMVSLSPIRQFQNYIMLPMIENYDTYSYDSYKMSLILPEEIELDQVQIGRKDEDEVYWTTLDSLTEVNKTDYFFPTVNAKSYRLFDLNLNVSETFYLKSQEPFMAYIRGTSQNEAYSLAAAFGLKSDKSNDNQRPVPTWTMDCNGDVTGTVTDMPDNIDEASCLYPPMLFEDSTENYTPFFESVNSPSVQSLNWELKIGNPNLKAFAKIWFVDRSGNDTILRIEYKPVVLSFSPDKVDFGIIEPGSSAEQEVELRNNSSADTQIEDLMLKGIAPGFDIIDSPAPFILAGGESRKIKLQFAATEPGEYADSLGVKDTCKSFYMLRTIGRIGYAKIDANDCDLGDILTGQETSQIVKVYNKGNIALKIHGVKLPVNPDIEIELPKMPSESDPINIPRNSHIEYKIKIKSQDMGEFRDSVVFYSNSISKADSVSYIEAIAIQPGILSKNYDFGRKTVGFEYSTEGKGIKIKNSGNTNISITDIITENDNSKGVFKFDKNDVCKEIAIGDSIYLPVKFEPTDTKYYSMDLKYRLGDGTISKSVTKLSGTGVLAKLAADSEQIDLGVALINISTDIKKASVTVRNLDQTQWEFADRVVITGLQPIDNSIGIGKDNFSRSGFAVDDSDLDFPLELLPGDEFSFNVYFRAFSETAEASLSVDNDAERSLIIEFEGKGAKELVALNSEPVAACFGTEEQFELEIINYGTTDIDFKAPTFEQSSSEFYFADPANDFTVKQGKTHKIPINYRPESVDALSSAKVNIEAKNGSEVKLSREITGKAVNISREVAMQPLSVVVPIGEKTVKTVKLLSGENISDLDIQSLHIEVEFTSNFLAVDRESISLSKDLAGFFDLQNVQTDNDRGIIEADIVSISDHIIDEGADLLDIEFETYLSTIETTKSDIKVKVSSGDSRCVLFESIAGQIELQPYCAGDISKILINGSNLEAPKVNPNPINTDKFELSFSLGYDADISLEIVDVNGKTIKTILEGMYKAGDYLKEISTEKIPAGVYFIKLQSATIYLTEKLVIVK